MRKLSSTEIIRPDPKTFQQQDRLPVTLMLHDIRSLHNIGAAFRSADAFAIQAVLLSGFSPTPPHRQIAKTALGAEQVMDWRYVDHAPDALRILKEQGYRILAVEHTDKSESIANFKPDGRPVVLIMGNEVDGVHADLLAECDEAVEVPMYGTKTSLNVSVCVGVALYALSTAYRG